MKKFIILVSLLLFSLQNCCAEDWVRVGDNAWLDVDSIEKIDRNTKTVWTKFDVSKKDEKTIKGTKIYWIYNNDIIYKKPKAFLSISEVTYDNQGRQIGTAMYPYGETPQPITPVSILSLEHTILWKTSNKEFKDLKEASDIMGCIYGNIVFNKPTFKDKLINIFYPSYWEKEDKKHTDNTQPWKYD